MDDACPPSAAGPVPDPVPAPTPEDAEVVARRSMGPWTILWKKLLRNRVACIGGVILIVLYGTACFAGFLAPFAWDARSPDSSCAPPALFGGYELLEVASKGDAPPDYVRRWRPFRGGIHFRDPQGNFTLRPHVHPIAEVSFIDPKGDLTYVRGVSVPDVSLPVEFFVESEEPHEVFSVLGFFKVTGRMRLFGVRAPDGTPGYVGAHLLGTDSQGRDLFTRILFGAQVSLSVGILCILVTTSLGMLIGGFAGYLGGWFENVSMRVVEVVLSVPDLYLIIVLGGIVRDWQPGGQPLSSRDRYLLIVLVMAFVGWAGRARVIRGMVLPLRHNDYVIAARAIGVSTPRIIVKHILPNTMSFVIVSATLAIPGYILAEVALSFLGLGIQEPEPSWGNMLREAQQASILVENPWVVVPGVFIFITVLAYNFLGDGLRDAADPRVVLLKKG